MSAPSQTPVPSAEAEQPKQEDQKLSPAELKKKAKADKQARRAAQKEQQEGSIAGPSQPNGAPVGRRLSQSAGSGVGPKPKGPPPRGAQRPGESSAQAGSRQGAPQTNLALRRRPSHSEAPKPHMKKENKQVELFSHLYSQPRRHSIDGVPKEVHPAVLALGFQISSYEICGSSARCVGMLRAFQAAIARYTTPSGTSLARHLTSHYLSPQIDFLRACRPLAESMGNAIRWLKKLIVEIDPATPETEAKLFLHQRIDRFVQERVTVTDQVIAAAAGAQITPGAVVLTFAKSAVVEQTLLRAHAAGTKFRVVVVDAVRPLAEGRRLATGLMRAGLEVAYYPFAGLARAVADATLVLLGAHSMLSNGRLQSRVGTAALAMAAHHADIPVIVCCESVKFSGKVALDSVVSNEVAPSEELLLPPLPAGEAQGAGQGKGDEEEKLKTLHDWREIRNLQILNLMYDVTPAEYIRMVICEYGNVPPSSVPVVHRLANEAI